MFLSYLKEIKRSFVLLPDVIDVRSLGRSQEQQSMRSRKDLLSYCCFYGAKVMVLGRDPELLSP